MSDLGLYSLRFALLMAAVALVAGLGAGIRRRADWTQLAERALWMVFGFVSLSMLSLFWALAYSDFQLAYVAQHSARSTALCQTEAFAPMVTAP